jgi:hypothetical protein
MGPRLQAVGLRPRGAHQRAEQQGVPARVLYLVARHSDRLVAAPLGHGSARRHGTSRPVAGECNARGNTSVRKGAPRASFQHEPRRYGNSARCHKMGERRAGPMGCG